MPHPVYVAYVTLCSVEENSSFWWEAIEKSVMLSECFIF
jgi:hypothetical protein